MMSSRRPSVEVALRVGVRLPSKLPHFMFIVALMSMIDPLLIPSPRGDFFKGNGEELLCNRVIPEDVADGDLISCLSCFRDQIAVPLDSMAYYFFFDFGKGRTSHTVSITLNVFFGSVRSRI